MCKLSMTRHIPQAHGPRHGIRHAQLVHSRRAALPFGLGPARRRRLGQLDAAARQVARAARGLLRDLELRLKVEGQVPLLLLLRVARNTLRLWTARGGHRGPGRASKLLWGRTPGGVGAVRALRRPREAEGARSPHAGWAALPPAAPPCPAAAPAAPPRAPAPRRAVRRELGPSSGRRSGGDRRRSGEVVRLRGVEQGPALVLIAPQLLVERRLKALLLLVGAWYRARGRVGARARELGSG